MSSLKRYVKTINGRQYIYEQEPYRVGTKVKNKMTYIGPVDRFISANIDGTAIGNPFLTPSKVAQADQARSKKQDPLIHNLSLLKAYKTSTASVEHQWSCYRKQLGTIELTLPQSTQLSFTSGDRLRHSISPDGRVEIVLPTDASMTNRNKVHAEIRRALTKQYLQLLASQKPGQYRRLLNTTTGFRSFAWTCLVNHLAQSAKSLSPAMIAATWSSLIYNDDSKYLDIDLSTPSALPAEAERVLSDLMHKGVTTTKKKLDADWRNNQRRLNRAIKDYYQLSAIKKPLSKGRALRRKIKEETKLSKTLSEQRLQSARLSPYWQSLSTKKSNTK